VKPLLLAALLLSLPRPTPGAGIAPLEPLPEPVAARYARALKLDGVGKNRLKRVHVRRNLEYIRRGDLALTLDFYSPTKQPRRLPCIVVITGGGFSARTPANFAPFAAHLASQGFATACIGYRGRPGHTYQATIRDTKAAVRFVRKNADKLGVDPDRLGAMGQSAGGHLAAMLAVSDGVSVYETDAGDADVSSRIQAAVSFAGVFDFISRLKDGGHQQHGLATKRKTNGEWIGQPFSESSAAWQEASPISHLDRTDPPLLLVHCRSDRTVPVEQTEQMIAALEKLSARSRSIIFEEGGGHGITAARDVNQRAWAATVRFFKEILTVAEWRFRR